jgi:hypothetical protein
MEEETSATPNKKPREVYRDPIFGIPHYHEPALSRLIRKHDAATQISEDLRAHFAKSERRLRAVQTNKPRFMHTRFNIEALAFSPLLCLPHFSTMYNYLRIWFECRENRQLAAITKAQQAKFDAQEKFSRGLFLLLQDIARSAPLDPKPLRFVYLWYLQRDSVIDQSRMSDRPVTDDGFWSVELADGQTLRVPRKLIDAPSLLPQSMFDMGILTEQMKTIELSPPPIIEEPIIEVRKHHAQILTETFPNVPFKRAQPPRQVSLSFDYESFHKEMVEQRKSDADTAVLARAARTRRLAALQGRLGWD